MNDLSRALSAVVRGRIALDVPLAPRTTIRLGGRAALWFEPRDPQDLVAALRVFRDAGAAPVVLGGGANTLISDEGIGEPVIHLTPGFAGVEWMSQDESGGEAFLGAGLTGIKALQAARSRGLIGPEFLVGIPGTLGGQVAMNAGTKTGEMSRLLRAVELATADGLRLYDAARLNFSYRHCELPPGAVVTRLRMRFSRGDTQAGDAQLRWDMAYRRRTQPWAKPNLGSTFKNPPGDFAGRLIEACGLKGSREGEVAFSDLHANFLVNLGGNEARGRATDALRLIRRAQATVQQEAGVMLALEVVLAGRFPPAGAEA
jgi:UDP-N-acetylmuramate dehydrogenase